jgi:hypothetical protein
VGLITPGSDSIKEVMGGAEVARQKGSRFSNRTILLMILALVVFARFWWWSHRKPPAPQQAPGVMQVELAPRPDGRARDGGD